MDAHFANYKIYRDLNSGVSEDVSLRVAEITVKGTLIFTDTALQEGTTYYYKVYVENDLGETMGSNFRSGRTDTEDTYAAIESVALTPAGPFAPGATVHFAVTPVDLEKGGITEITVAGIAGTITALDDGIQRRQRPVGFLYLPIVFWKVRPWAE